MKKALSIIFAMLIALSCLSAAGVTAFAEDELTYGIFTYKINDNKVTITGVTDTNITESEIPSEIDGKTVTCIDDWAFYELTKLSSITIPDSVTSIGEGAFSGCTALTNIAIPNSVTVIGREVFSGCTSLLRIVIPDSVTSIGEEVLSGCPGLTSINVSKGNTVYDSRNDCNAIIETKSNKLIAGCKNTTIPDGVTSIADYTFYYCTGLTSITIPDSVTSIGVGAFSKCKGLNSVTIPNGITSISKNAFSFCESLTSITIPNSVTSIGRCAFGYCSNLKSIEIPDSVTSISEYAFKDCNNLKDIYYSGTEESWNSINIASYNDLLTTAKFENTSGKYTWIHLITISDAPAIAIAGMSEFNGKRVGYKTTITFHAEVEKGSANDVVWYVNGKKAGTGESYTVSQATADYDIYCEVTDSDGNTINSAAETVHVKTSFIAKLIAFFRSLFGLLPVYDQK